jgi:hypothetical protein
MSKYFIIFLFALLAIISCRKRTINNDTSVALNFSTDSIAFDTVFSRFDTNNAPLSTTKVLKIYNPYNSIVYTDIRLMGGIASVYRINIDGKQTDHVTHYRIEPKDSFYLFVQVTPRIANAGNPLFVEDSIMFTSNGNEQKVHLVAWGQDAHYLMDSVIDYDAVWSDKTRPYVIWKSILVAPGKKLTINQGVKVCSHVGSYIYVQGTLEMQGTYLEPIILQGDRLERNLDDVPNQWWGVRFLQGSKDNIINNAVIKNAVIGVEIDSAKVTSNANLKMNNTVIRTMSSSCISAYGSTATFTNCAFFDAGQLCVFAQYGGNYSFTYCTIANPHCINFQSNYPSFYLGNADYNVTDAAGNILQVIPSFLKYSMVNTIIYGQSSNDEEFAIYDGGRPNNVDTPTIDHCLIRTKVLGISGKNGNLTNLDPKFKDMCKYNYQLDTLSPAIISGVAVPTVNFDILGKLRNPNPCMGAYEKN